jgi:arylsulfatase A-like enzyme
VLLGEPLQRYRLLELADQIGDADRRYVEDVYDNEIQYQDAQIGALVRELERLGLMDDTVVAVLSDHGEEFLEHGEWNHGYRMWEELLRVPLVLHVPERLRRARGLEPRVIDAPVSQVDFLPGLLDLLGVVDRFPRQGRSWLPLLSGEDADLFPYYGEDYQAWEGDEIGAFQSGNHKLIWRRFYAEAREELELYDLAADPGEQHDLAAQRPEVLANLASQRETFARLRALVREDLRAAGIDAAPADAHAPPVTLDAHERDELERLGYVGDD